MAYESAIKSDSFISRWVPGCNNYPRSLQSAASLNRVFSLIFSETPTTIYQYISVVPDIVCGLKNRVISNFLQGDFLIQSGSSNAKEPPDVGEIKIGTLNILGFNEDLTRKVGGLPKWKDRFTSIVNKIRDADLDVLNLQEVMDAELAYALYEEFKSEYFHFAIDIGPGLVGMPSGLMVMSKFKIEDPRFSPFEKKVGGDHWTNKGIFDYTIRLSAQKTVHIANSHFQSGPFDEQGSTRSGLIAMLKRCFGFDEVLTIENTRNAQAEQAKKILENGGVMCGDLNSDRLRDEYTSFPLNPAVDSNVKEPVTDAVTCTVYFEHYNEIRDIIIAKETLAANVEEKAFKAAKHLLEIKKRADEGASINDFFTIDELSKETQEIAVDYIKSHVGEDVTTEKVREFLAHLYESLDRIVGVNLPNDIKVENAIVTPMFDVEKSNMDEVQCSDHHLLSATIRLFNPLTA